MLLPPLLSVLLSFLLSELVPDGQKQQHRLTLQRMKDILSFRQCLGVVKAVVLSPGLPASAAVPNSAEGGQPVGVSVRAVVKVGSDSVWWKLPQLLLLLWKKTNERL